MLDRLASLYTASRPQISSKYAKYIIAICQRCSAACSGELDPLRIAEWLREQVTVKSATTAAAYRRMITAVLNWAHQEGLVDKPIRLPRIRAFVRTPEAWTIGELEKLLRVASALTGRVGDVPARLWWQTLIEVLYWTGARIGSVLSAKVGDWDAANRVLFLENKKGFRKRPYSIPTETAIKLCQLAERSNGHLFEWPHSLPYLFVQFRKIVKGAGIRYQPKAFGLFHRIRRTAASYLWRSDPSAAQQLLDHSSADVTFRHYVDPTIVGSTERAVSLLPRPDTGQLVLPFPWG